MTGNKQAGSHGRVWARYKAANPNPSNDERRAYDLLYLTVTDNGGWMNLLDLPDDWILDIVRLARQIRAELQEIDAKERAGELRLVPGGRR